MKSTRLRRFEEADVPVAIIAAEHDEIVPSQRTEAPETESRTSVFDRTIARAGHNGIYARSEFQEAMRSGH